jgi:membrane associated rhomboid family serine protease
MTDHHAAPALTRTSDTVTVSLIALNALVFLYQLPLDSRGVQLVSQFFGLVPAYLS